MTLNSKKKDFILTEGLWKGYNLYELYKVAHTPFEWHKEIFLYASKKGITLFSTPFDESAFELLEDLNCPAYKIASFENHDLKLQMITNRGVKVYPNGNPHTFCTDHWRCRFKFEKQPNT